VQLSTEIYVPRDIIFELSTEAAHLACWFCPNNSDQASFTIDENAYTYAWETEDGKKITGSGNLVASESTIELTGVEIQEDRTAQIHVQITLVDQGPATRINVEQTGLPDEDISAIWKLRFTALKTYLSSI
jgi:uncharacterized protein YndB with AHSA1/START domain